MVHVANKSELASFWGISDMEPVVGVLMGGFGGERSISQATGLDVHAALHELGYDTKMIDTNRDVDKSLRSSRISVAFVALHGPLGEDGCLQGLLEVLSIPYTGPSVLAASLCMDKARAKDLFAAHGVPTPRYYLVRAADLAQLEELHGDFGFPVFVKPRRGGSSLGAGRAADLPELRRRCRAALEHDSFALVETFLEGVELTVATLCGSVLGAAEIVTDSGVYDYRAKYEPGRTQYFCPPRLPDAVCSEVLAVASNAVHAVAVSGSPRVDVILTSEGPQVLEIDAIPGLTRKSIVPHIAAVTGIPYEALCKALLSDARLHCGTQLDAIL